MKSRIILVFFTMILLAGGAAFAQGSARAGISFCCSPSNDLYKLMAADGEKWSRFDNPQDAVRNAPPGTGLLILADDYPRSQVVVTEQVIQEAASKEMRLYIEFPQKFVGMTKIREPRIAQWERMVVYAPWFGNKFKKNELLTAHACHYLPLEGNMLLVMARVAGYDTAEYPLPEWIGIRNDAAELFPVLVMHPLTKALIASTKLSNFATGRYAPTERWRLIWQKIIEWASGKPFEMRQWVKTVGTAYGPEDKLPADAQEQAWRKAAQWYLESRMLVHSDWANKVQETKKLKDQIGPPPDEDNAIGDGTLGILEGYSSTVEYTGRQPVRYWIRGDCVSESSMVLALAGLAQNNQKLQQVSKNLQEFLYRQSPLTSGPRSDPQSPSFGLIGWNTDSGAGTYYGDDNARAILGTMAASAALKNDQWTEPLLKALLANLRTTGKQGFRGDALTEETLRQGWRHFYDAEPVNISPHYESYLWACYLWAYKHTGFAPFLERAKAGISRTMVGYPNDWRWVVGMQEERARMLLPLAWLVQVENNDQNKQWLRQVAGDLLKLQDKSGAIREELGDPAKGVLVPAQSNKEYGTKETPVITKNGDPACDILYTLGFAMIGLHEAAAATGDAFYGDAENKLADFLCRIQVTSKVRPEFNGAWFRGFDFNKWEYWGSNGDAGWGVWSVESGWGQSWVATTMVLRQLKQSFWDFTAPVDIKKHLPDLQAKMLGN